METNRAPTCLSFLYKLYTILWYWYFFFKIVIFDWIESICFMWIWEAGEYWSCKSLRTFMSFPYIDLSQKGKQEEKECLKENSVGIEQWSYEDPQYITIFSPKNFRWILDLIQLLQLYSTIITRNTFAGSKNYYSVIGGFANEVVLHGKNYYYTFPLISVM